MTSVYLSPLPLVPISGKKWFIALACIVLVIAMSIIPSMNNTMIMEPSHLIGGNAALCGAAIGFGIVAAAALTAETAGFGAALGLSAAIHIAALAC